MNKETKTIIFKIFCTTVAPAFAEVPADLDPKEYLTYLNDHYNQLVEIDWANEKFLSTEIVEDTLEEE